MMWKEASLEHDSEKKRIILLQMLRLNDFNSHTHMCVPQKGLGSHSFKWYPGAKYKVFILRLIWESSLHFSILE